MKTYQVTITKGDGSQPINHIGKASSIRVAINQTLAAKEFRNLKFVGVTASEQKA